MPLLKRKQEKTTTISVRVPMSAKQQMDADRQLADTKGFDLSGSLTDAVMKWQKQVHEELTADVSTTPSAVHKPHSQNGADGDRA
jgi:hypothetical protein